MAEKYTIYYRYFRLRGKTFVISWKKLDSILSGGLSLAPQEITIVGEQEYVIFQFDGLKSLTSENHRVKRIVDAYGIKETSINSNKLGWLYVPKAGSRHNDYQLFLYSPDENDPLEELRDNDYNPQS